MSKYNAYAKRLNDEFIAVRSAFMELYEGRKRAAQFHRLGKTDEPGA